MKIRVDQEKCQGHTLCAMAAPKLFQLSDFDGHATAISDDVPPELEDAAQDATGACPEQAIILTD